jgi:hypothetical protein
VIAGSRDGRHVGDNAAAVDVDLSDVLDQLEDLTKLGPAFAYGRETRTGGSLPGRLLTKSIL